MTTATFPARLTDTPSVCISLQDEGDAYIPRGSDEVNEGMRAVRRPGGVCRPGIDGQPYPFTAPVMALT